MFKNISVACSVVLFCSVAGASDSAPRETTKPQSVCFPTAIVTLISDYLSNGVIIRETKRTYIYDDKTEEWGRYVFCMQAFTDIACRRIHSENLFNNSVKVTYGASNSALYAYPYVSFGFVPTEKDLHIFSAGLIGADWKPEPQILKEHAEQKQETDKARLLFGTSTVPYDADATFFPEKKNLVVATEKAVTVYDALHITDQQKEKIAERYLASKQEYLNAFSKVALRQKRKFGCLRLKNPFTQP